MNCEFINEHILDYLDSELNDRDLDKFTSHLAECSACHDLVGEIGIVYKLAEKPNNFRVSVGFVEKTVAGALKKEAKIVPLIYQVLKPIAVAASVGLGILIGNGELSLLNAGDNNVSEESIVMSTAAAADYSLWQSFEEYGNEN